MITDILQAGGPYGFHQDAFRPYTTERFHQLQARPNALINAMESFYEDNENARRVFLKINGINKNLKDIKIHFFRNFLNVTESYKTIVKYRSDRKTINAWRRYCRAQIRKIDHGKASKAQKLQMDKFATATCIAPKLSQSPPLARQLNFQDFLERELGLSFE